MKKLFIVLFCITFFSCTDVKRGFVEYENKSNQICDDLLRQRRYILAWYTEKSRTQALQVTDSLILKYCK